MLKITVMKATIDSFTLTFTIESNGEQTDYKAPTEFSILPLCRALLTPYQFTKHIAENDFYRITISNKRFLKFKEELELQKQRYGKS